MAITAASPAVVPDPSSWGTVEALRRGPSGSEGVPVGSTSLLSTWCSRDIAEWSNSEVRDFVESVLPGHTCVQRFGHTTGRVLASLTKDDLRRQAKDEEATNVIWVELQRLKRERSHHAEVASSTGDEPYTIFVRTPLDVSVELEVTATMMVAELKERMAKLEGTPVATQRLVWNGVPMLDRRTLASYHVGHGSVVLLVPRLAASGQQRYAAPAVVARGGLQKPSTSSGIPRPRVPIICNDIVRPWPMSLEFTNIPEYQAFMLSLQREGGPRGAAPQDAPILEILSDDPAHLPVQTRISFDPEVEVLLIDTVGDILVEGAKYRVLLHLREEQRLAHLVTGFRDERA